MSAVTRVGSLCTGYGGLEMALRLAGIDVNVRWLAEVDASLSVLHGGVRNLGDVAAVDWSAVEPIDILTAGFPCQPVSTAGRQRGDADARWLWPVVRQAVAELQPTHVFIENVRNLVAWESGRLWAGILADLEALGYGVRWLTLGACHVGAAHHRHRVFAVATMGETGAHRVATTFCGAKGVTILPTPTARDGGGRGEGDAAYWSARAETRTNGMPLGAALALLPTPAACDAKRGWSTSNHGGRDVTSLAGVGQLLSTTTAAPRPGHWGRFAEAVARHESLYWPAPAPTEPNRNGAPRLAPAFAEWLMCLPVGHVTTKLARADALRAIGNGVCPPQAAAAWRYLVSDYRVRELLTGELGGAS